MNKEEIQKWLEDSVSDMFMDFLYYYRKEDEVVNLDTISSWMKTGLITKQDMIKAFTEQIEIEYQDIDND